MAAERLQDFIRLDIQTAASLFAPVCPSIQVQGLTPCRDSMSNSGYEVATNHGKYLLKLYSNNTDSIETAAYSFLAGKIPVPRLYYYDGEQTRFPYPYAVLEFLEGCTLHQAIRDTGEFSPETARQIGKMCGVMHQIQYSQDAMLDGNLGEGEPIPDTRERILFLLNGKPGSRLEPDTVHKTEKFIRENTELFDRIGAKSVLCHGDFRLGNIMLAKGQAYLIDFEFAFSGSPYYDMGYFFRNKSEKVQPLMKEPVQEAFADGYRETSPIPLPPDWLELAKLCDICNMLCMLNHDTIPPEWVSEVESRILQTIRAR